MTAQVGILNKRGVALATDSAVTIGIGKKEKAFNSANKLFEMIKGRPVGIMIYNNAEFLEVPWEIIIADYTRHNSAIRFDTLKEYCEHFILFITQATYLKNQSLFINTLQRVVLYHINNIMEALNVEIEKLEEDKVLSTEEIKGLFIKAVGVYHEYILETKGIYGGYLTLYEEDQLKPYQVDILDVVNLAVGNSLRLTDEEKIELVEVLKAAVLSNEMSHNYTGIVVAGYGEKEIFPSLYQLEIEMMVDNNLKVRVLDPVIISNLSDDEYTTAAIKTFAQGEVAQTYICGIDPTLQCTIDKAITRNLGTITELFEDFIELNGEVYDLSEEELASLQLTTQQKELLTSFGGEFSHQLQEYLASIAHEYYARPFVEMVEAFDKQQLSQLAETLINLTSFKREMSIETNSVGGPVDVAVISRTEGFVWIKRKSYFDIALNPLYLEKEEEEVIW